MLNAFITLRERALNKGWQMTILFAAFVLEGTCHPHLGALCSCKEAAE